MLTPIVTPGVKFSGYTREARKIDRMMDGFGVSYQNIACYVTVVRNPTRPATLDYAHALRDIAVEICDIILHLLPDTSSSTRSAIILNLLLHNPANIREILTGTCTREFLEQFAHNPLPQIWLEHNLPGDPPLL